MIVLPVKLDVIGFVCLFLEGGEGEGEGRKPNWLPLIAPNWDLAYNPGVCPD